MIPRSKMRRLLLATISVLTLAASAHAMEISAPQNHARLRGGSFATLAWHTDTLPSYADEWEAFLSIDGGRTYAFRITPHLDARIHRFTWVVPNVDTRDARILIRFGDEHQENAVELPPTFSITRDARADLVLQPRATRMAAEAARPGDAPVVAQSEGDRSGSGAETRIANTPRREIESASQRHVAGIFAAVPPATGATATQAQSSHALPASPRSRVPASPKATADILTLTTRLNV